MSKVSKWWLATGLVGCVLGQGCAGVPAPGAEGPASGLGQPVAGTSGAELSPVHAAAPSPVVEAPVAAPPAPAEGPACVAADGADDVRISDPREVSDVLAGDAPTLFEVGELSVRVPACTADAGVVTVTLEKEARPVSARVHPQFERHGATFSLDAELHAPSDDAPIVIGRKARRKPTQPGRQLVLAVEHNVDCDDDNAGGEIDGGCSGWRLYGSEFDAGRGQVVARVPETGGYRLQFGWMPASFRPDGG